VAATVLGIPTDAVFIAETSTDKVPHRAPSTIGFTTVMRC
jgi:xanthine dehydrogenase molybdopterin-binding subunit B